MIGQTSCRICISEDIMSKRLIAYSLYGKHPLYLKGALSNARYVHYFYPDWVCRFYVSNEISAELINNLKKHGAEVIPMGQRINQEAMLWRFLAGADPDLDVIIFRDADSCFSKREILAVQEWLFGNKKFHIMRDHPLHNTEVLGGMWGMRGSMPNLRQLIANWHSAQLKSSFSKGYDQRFLRKVLYPLMAEDACVHQAHHADAYLDALYLPFVDENSVPFPVARKSARDYVGRIREGVSKIYSGHLVV